MSHIKGDTSPERRLVEDVRRGVRSAEAQVERALQGLRDHARLNLLVGPPMDEALTRARAIDRARAVGRSLGPLAGLPIVVKDNIAVAGRPLTGASPALKGYRPRRTAGSVARLVDAGAVVVGQTNMHELALVSRATTVPTVPSATLTIRVARPEDPAVARPLPSRPAPCSPGWQRIREGRAASPRRGAAPWDSGRRPGGIPGTAS